MLSLVEQSSLSVCHHSNERGRTNINKAFLKPVVFRLAAVLFWLNYKAAYDNWNEQRLALNKDIHMATKEVVDKLPGIQQTSVQAFSTLFLQLTVNDLGICLPITNTSQVRLPLPFYPVSALSSTLKHLSCIKWIFCFCLFVLFFLRFCKVKMNKLTFYMHKIGIMKQSFSFFFFQILVYFELKKRFLFYLFKCCLFQPWEFNKVTEKNPSFLCPSCYIHQAQY